LRDLRLRFKGVRAALIYKYIKWSEGRDERHGPLLMTVNFFSIKARHA